MRNVSLPPHRWPNPGMQIPLGLTHVVHPVALLSYSGIQVQVRGKGGRVSGQKVERAVDHPSSNGHLH